MVLELKSGRLTYVSDKLRGHDGNTHDLEGNSLDLDGNGTIDAHEIDGAGNVLTLNITANDRFGHPSGSSGSSTATVNLRLNVAPTDVIARQPDAGANASTDPSVNPDLIAALKTVTGGALVPVTLARQAVILIELNENQVARGGEVVAKLDVQDENAKDHKFGTHELTVSGDDRFVITKSGGANAPRTATGTAAPGAAAEARREVRLRDGRQGRPARQRLHAVPAHVRGHRRRRPEHAGAASRVV